MDVNVKLITRPALLMGALVAVGATVLAGCTSSSGSHSGGSGKNGSAYGSLPAQSGTPKDGGVVNIAESPGAGPTYIFPVIPGSANSVYVSFQFQWLMFRPLYWYPTGASPKINDTLSLADEPVYSDGNKTVTINLKQTYKWADGAPVTADDLIFDIDLIKAAIKENAGNWADYTPGQFPDNVVSATATSKYTVTMQLDRSYNPAWFTNNELTGLTPLPSTNWNASSDGGAHLDFTQPANAKAIYDYLAKASASPTTFATNPLWQDVDGPFKLKSFNASTDAFSMVPNPAYTGPQKPHIAQLNALAFTSGTAEFNQLKSGQLTAGAVDPSNLSQVAALQRAGYNVYGLPNYGFNFIMLNFKDKTNNVDKILGQLYIRQALDHLIDQPAYIKSKGIYNGAAGENYSSVPSISGSPYTTSGTPTAPYPYDVDAATKLLSDHGWKVVPNGETTCQKPGTGANECGAGIPQGQTIKFNLFYSNQTPVNAVQCTAFASAAKQIGVTVETQPKTFSYLIQHFNDPAAPADVDNWAMEQWGGFSISPYPTANSIFNTTGSGNVGGYSDAQADKLIHDSVYGSDPKAVQAEGDYLSKNLPVLWLPSQDRIWAWKKTLSGPSDSFASLTQNTFTPEYWYFTQ
jgi:peptide/nickel transport system substrate-binding protein